MRHFQPHWLSLVCGKLIVVTRLSPVNKARTKVEPRRRVARPVAGFVTYVVTTKDVLSVGLFASTLSPPTEWPAETGIQD